jgi:ACT domain-containing protein
MSKTIVTLIGKDRVGIIATVCSFFGDNDINILDLKQTTSQGYINMMMIVDTETYKGSMADLNKGLEEVGEKVGCIIKAQHEDIFNMMHRI